MGFKILYLGREPHYCNLPNWRKRRRLGIKPRAQVQCDQCGWIYEWDDRGWGDAERYWRKLHYNQSADKLVVAGEAPPRSEN